MIVVTRLKPGRAIPRTDAGAGVNSWFMSNHMRTQSESLRKAARVTALGSQGKYLMTKAEKRRAKDRLKREKSLLASE